MSLRNPADSSSHETLSTYWPIDAPQRGWNLIDQATHRVMMTVTYTAAGPKETNGWYYNKPSKPGTQHGDFDIEHYRYCESSGNNPWLFLDEYIDAVKGKPWLHHPIVSTRLLFTPDGGETTDLIADGTYARCGARGEPMYLGSPLIPYRLQAWGFLTENPKWKWYLDARVSSPAMITNDCSKPAQTVMALRVQEVWWDNFPEHRNVGAFSWGSTDVDRDGIPTGAYVKYGRSLWFANAGGPTPYYLLGDGNGKVTWCTNALWKVPAKLKPAAR